MSETEKTQDQAVAMTIPKSILFTTIKGAITSGEDQKIQDLTDILYGSMESGMSLMPAVALQSNRLEAQHHEVMSLVESMKEGFNRMDRRFEELRQDMNTRFEQVDKRFEELRQDMTARFEQVDRRFEQVDKRFEQVDRRFEQVDKRFEQVDKHFEQVDKHFEQVDKHFEQVDKRFEQVDKRFAMMMWAIGIGFSIVVAFMGSSVVLLR